MFNSVSHLQSLQRPSPLQLPARRGVSPAASPTASPIASPAISPGVLEAINEIETTKQILTKYEARAQRLLQQVRRPIEPLLICSLTKEQIQRVFNDPLNVAPLAPDPENQLVRQLSEDILVDGLRGILDATYFNGTILAKSEWAQHLPFTMLEFVDNALSQSEAVIESGAQQIRTLITRDPFQKAVLYHLRQTGIKNFLTALLEDDQLIDRAALAQKGFFCQGDSDSYYCEISQLPPQQPNLPGELRCVAYYEYKVCSLADPANEQQTAFTLQARLEYFITRGGATYSIQCPILTLGFPEKSNPLSIAESALEPQHSAQYTHAQYFLRYVVKNTVRKTLQTEIEYYLNQDCRYEALVKNYFYVREHFKILKLIMLQSPDIVPARLPLLMDLSNQSLHQLIYAPAADLTSVLGNLQREINRSKFQAVLPTAEDFYKRAARHNRSGAFNEAIADCTRTLQLQPNYPEVYVERAFAYLRLGQDQQVLPDCDQAIRLAPNIAVAYYYRAYSNRKLLKHRERRGRSVVNPLMRQSIQDDFQKANQLDPGLLIPIP